MWGSRHREMADQGHRGDGGPEKRQDAVSPLPGSGLRRARIFAHADRTGRGAVASGQESASRLFFGRFA